MRGEGEGGRERERVMYTLLYCIVSNDNLLLHIVEDLMSEQAILKWYKGAYLPDKKDTFLLQMKKMADWLATADEESDEG